MTFEELEVKDNLVIADKFQTRPAKGGKKGKVETGRLITTVLARAVVLI